MQSSWVDTTVGEFCPFIYGKSLPARVRDESGSTPVYGSGGISGYHSKSHVERPGVIIGRKGTVGSVRFCDGPFWPIDTTFYVTKEDKLDLLFTYYLLKSLGLEKLNSDSAVPGLNREEAHSIPIRVPPLEVRRNIAKSISCYDSKINLNLEVNQTLEQIAQDLFKSWFVDFDPVVDNALAAGNPIPDELSHRVEVRKKAHALPDFQPLSEHTRSLFPSEFEQTGEPTVGIGGWVPKGWSAMSLGDVTKELRRGISPKYTDEGGVQVINQKCIRNHEVNYALSRRNDPTLRKVDGREIEIGDVLVNSTGVGTLGRLAQVNAVPEPTVVDSHVTVVRPNPQICPIYFFGQLMVSKERSIESLGEGSTGQTELSRRILAEQLVLVPPYEQAMLIEGQLKSLSDKSSLNLKQNSALAKLRETLLPKLISGEINIKDTKECNG